VVPHRSEIPKRPKARHKREKGTLYHSQREKAFELKKKAEWIEGKNGVGGKDRSLRMAVQGSNRLRGKIFSYSEDGIGRGGLLTGGESAAYLRKANGVPALNFYKKTESRSWGTSRRSMEEGDLTRGWISAWLCELLKGDP